MSNRCPTAAFWWRWNRGWEELESGLPNHAAKRDAPQVTSPQVQVPADEMQKLLVHKVDPEYPAAARQEKLQGVILLEVVVGRDGTVLETRALNGPDVLAQAAMEAHFDAAIGDLLAAAPASSR